MRQFIVTDGNHRTTYVAPSQLDAIMWFVEEHDIPSAEHGYVVAEEVALTEEPYPAGSVTHTEEVADSAPLHCSLCGRAIQSDQPERKSRSGQLCLSCADDGQQALALERNDFPALDDAEVQAEITLASQLLPAMAAELRPGLVTRLDALTSESQYRRRQRLSERGVMTV